MEHHYQPEEVVFSHHYQALKIYYTSPHQPPSVNNLLHKLSSSSSSASSISPYGQWSSGHNESLIIEDADAATLTLWHPNIVQWASQQPHCLWPLGNLAYCLLLLLGASLQKSVFGNLRASEEENVKDQFWNLVFYKVVFVFGVVNVQQCEDAVGWMFFVSIIGFLQLARQLCQERHNYLILMNDWSAVGRCRRHRILALLIFIFFSSILLFLAVFGGWYFGCGLALSPKGRGREGEKQDSLLAPPSPSAYDFNLGLHSAIFMCAELALLFIQCLHALLICIFEQLKAKYWKGRQISEEAYANASNSINFKFELVSLLFDLVHHVHMLVCCNLFLSMTSLVVSLQMRARVRQIHNVLKKRQCYLWLNEHIDQYADYIPEKVGTEDEEEKCAICWDGLSSQKAKRLPCSHVFHSTCLRQWLLVTMNCPSCRLSLVNEKEAGYCSMERRPRRAVGPRPIGIWGFLQTGQALLDLFGGWDPQYEDVVEETTDAQQPQHWSL